LRSHLGENWLSAVIRLKAAPVWQKFYQSKGVAELDLTIWIPAMLLLGLLALGSMFAFVFACDRV